MTTGKLTLDSEPNIFLILHNIRSAHNVGSIFRTADGIGVVRIYLTGYTPAPALLGALHKTTAQLKIAKTALGAEEWIPWKKVEKSISVIRKLKASGVEIIGVEQHECSQNCFDYYLTGSAALIVGNEVRGIDKRTLAHCDRILEIPMMGKKDSLNVSVALGVVGYQIFHNAVQK